MSNALAIAAVTKTLQKLIRQGIEQEDAGAEVSTQPLDKAGGNGNTPKKINIFLYQSLANAAWRNLDMPNRVKPGETSKPPLALNLYYLITAYGKDNDIEDHRLLGIAMRILHDNALLHPKQIEGVLADSDLHNQVERISITPITLSLEEVSKLWGTFQTQYRISAAYQVSVVLIESAQAVKAPLPVLSRGEPNLNNGSDSGIAIQPDLTSSFPTLETLETPNQQPSLRLGENLTLRGHNLDSEETIVVEFRHPRLSQAIQLTPKSGSTATTLEVELPVDANQWLAGFYTVTVRVKRNGKQQVTNALSFSLVPKIEDMTISTASGNQQQLTLTCNPPVWLGKPDTSSVILGQQVGFLLGGSELLPLSEFLPSVTTTSSDPSPDQKTNSLVFDITGIAAGDYWVRLRVDGVDSLLVNRTVTPPVFYSTEKLTVSG